MTRSAPRLELRSLTKRYGDRLAVDDLSFDVEPGRVTGFLGPNGAGKSTTMRLVLGLDTPDSGTATIDGTPYASLARPMDTIGALLEAKATHPGRSARNHLSYLAQTQRVPLERVTEVLDLVGLGAVADQRVRGFSLGMGQRLGVASALLADPRVLMLDEPVNGLDPDGVRWIRELLHSLAEDGRTVLLSSHLMSEMAITATHLVVIGGGRLIADCSTTEFVERHAPRSVRVRTPVAASLALALEAHGAHTDRRGECLTVTGLEPRQIGEVAAGHGAVLYELSPQQASLEDAFIEITRDVVEYADSTRTLSPVSDHIPAWSNS